MERHEAIARWLGWTQQDIEGVTHWVSPDGLNACPRHLPVRFDSDAAAVSLLPELVKKGYVVSLSSAGDHWICEIWDRSEKESISEMDTTIAAAITAAIGEMIGREGKE